MKVTKMAMGLALGSWLLAGCVVQQTQPGVHTESTTTVVLSETDQALATAVNAERRQAGVAELPLSGALTTIAREESAATAGGMSQTIDAGGRGISARMRGVVTHRGPKSAAQMVRYWMPGQRDILLGDFTQMGLATSVSADGKLHGVILFGGGTGRYAAPTVMSPAMAPAGL